MSKLYVPSKTHTPVDRVREALDRAERAISNLRDAGTETLDLLHLFDQIERRLHELEQQDVDVRVERTQFETLQQQLKRRKGRFLRQAGGSLREAREETEPARSRWWWYLDEIAVKQRRRRILRVAAGAAAAIVLLAGAWLGYKRFLAPPPEVGKAYRYMQMGQSELGVGDVRAALADFDAATELTPDDPEPWLWKGALHAKLEESAQAREAFTTAEPLYETRFDFVLNRARIHLHAGSVERARDDVEAAIELEPTSGWGYYLRAGIDAQEGNYDAALADLERAADLAREGGDGRLQALANEKRARLMQMSMIPTPE